MKKANELERGRESFRRRAWRDAYAQLSAADRGTSVGPEDLERLAVTAHLVGRDDDSADFWTRAHHEFVRAGDSVRAARCAFWLGFGLMMRGEPARGGGWLGRAKALLDEGQADCVERGFLLVPAALQKLDEGDPAAARATFEEAAKIGDRFGDRDLMTLGRLGQGQALIMLGAPAQGMPLLDEAMVAVTAGEVSPIVAGTVYCAALEACQDTLDLRRAHEWTAAMTRWCESQPDLVPYRGECLVHRAEIMQLHGAWRDAIDEAQQACERLSGRPTAASAFYQRAELHRLRGEFNRAEEAYREASRAGRRPEPGLALLRLAQGRVDAAAAAIRRVVDESQERTARSKVLPAYVEILLARDEVGPARAAADELSGIAADLDTPFLDAVAAQSTGAVLLSEGKTQDAYSALRQAWTSWQELEAPYEAARVRALMGLACRGLGDEDGAEMELDAARWVFQELGAAPDLRRIEALSRTAAAEAAGGLTAREVQVLRLVAAGKTNRAIAADLFLSEKTVARHVSNIFTKLGLSTRAAATAYAYEHDLV